MDETTRYFYNPEGVMVRSYIGIDGERIEQAIEDVPQFLADLDQDSVDLGDVVADLCQGAHILQESVSDIPHEFFEGVMLCNLRAIRILMRRLGLAPDGTLFN